MPKYRQITGPANRPMIGRHHQSRATNQPASPPVNRRCKFVALRGAQLQKVPPGQMGTKASSSLKPSPTPPHLLACFLSPSLFYLHVKLRRRRRNRRRRKKQRKLDRVAGLVRGAGTGRRRRRTRGLPVVYASRCRRDRGGGDGRRRGEAGEGACEELGAEVPQPRLRRRLPARAPHLHRRHPAVRHHLPRRYVRRSTAKLYSLWSSTSLNCSIG